MNRQIFDILKPKQNELVQSESSSAYKARSNLSSRYKQRRTDHVNDDQDQQRRSTINSNSTKLSRRRIVHLKRNGQKFDQYDQIHQSYDKQQKIMEQSPQSTYNIQKTEYKESRHGKHKSVPWIKQQDNNLIGMDGQPGDIIVQGEINKCITDQDANQLDHISLSDPIWQNILPDTMQLEQEDLEKLIDENPDYFNHQLGFCACFRCKCGTCKCDATNQIKLKVSSKLMSIYGKDFINKNRDDYGTLQPLNQPMYETKFLDQKPIDQITQSQVAFCPKQIPKLERYKAQFQPALGNVSQITSYRQNFGNWGAKDFQIFKREPHLSTGDELQFNAKSIYQENFCQDNQLKQEKQSIFRSSLQPLPTGPFNSMTTNEKAFVPFKIYKQQQSLPPTEELLQQKYQRIPVYNGQFNSTVNRDFKGISEQACPGQIYKKQWKQKLLMKYNQFREAKLNQGQKK